MDDDTPCPCGTGLGYGSCCGRLHRGGRAVTAVALMRSRYSAFVLEDAAYLSASWASATRPANVSFVPGQRWTELEIVEAVAGGMADREGIVSFEARFERHGRAGTHAERSAFVREDGRWVYVGEDRPR
jgi:SEC-C motif-containing protein